MRKTLIALFAVPALAGFAFAAPPPILTSIPQTIGISIPMYLALSTTTASPSDVNSLSGVNFNFADTTDTLATRYNLIPATLANYQTAVASGVDVIFGPTSGVPTSLSVTTNSKIYTLTATLLTDPSPDSPATADFLVGFLPQGSTGAVSYSSIGASYNLKAEKLNSKWNTAIDIYLGLIMRANATYNFDTTGAAIHRNAVLTYTVAHL